MGLFHIFGYRENEKAEFRSQDSVEKRYRSFHMKIGVGISIQVFRIKMPFSGSPNIQPV